MVQQQAPLEVDALVVGAGFAGLYALHRLRGLGLSARILEKAPELGGTWYWNCYPGARCDVESLQYSFSFSDEIQQEWSWSERFASQGEILRYLNFVADRLDLRHDIIVDCHIGAANFDEAAARWTLEDGNGRRFAARFLIFATGVLSAPIEPVIPGLSKFQGRVLRTSTWPREPIEFTGRRVAVVGTGSSGTQAIPEIAVAAKQLYVLQRTPNYAIPGRNRPMEPGFEREWKTRYREHREAALQTRNNNLFDAGVTPGRELSFEEREREFEKRWQRGGLAFTYGFPDTTLDPDVNRQASDFVRRKIAERVRDPAVAARLTPSDYGIGGRRLCVENGYYETFNRDNVTLVDLREEPLRTMTAGGFATAAREYAIDDLVLATGFDAFTGALARIDIRGRGGASLADKWCDGPDNYLGLMVAGFPNMFMVTGPGSPSVLSNVVISIEQHIDWIADCLRHLAETGLRTIEPRPEAEAEWVAHLAELAGRTLIYRTKSWYTGANVEGKPNRPFMYMGGTDRYVREIAEAGPGAGYPGFIAD